MESAVVMEYHKAHRIRRAPDAAAVAGIAQPAGESGQPRSKRAGQCPVRVKCCLTENGADAAARHLITDPESVFQPRLIKDACLVGKHEIFFGDRDDRVLARFGWLCGSGEKVLIALNASTPMGDILFFR
jgi:hypothetical protein